MSRREYIVHLLIWPCLNIRTCNIEMLVAPLSQMLDLSGSVHHLLVHLVHPLLALSASASAIHHTDHPHQVNQKRCHYM